MHLHVFLHGLGVAIRMACPARERRSHKNTTVAHRSASIFLPLRRA